LITFFAFSQLVFDLVLLCLSVLRLQLTSSLQPLLELLDDDLLSTDLGLDGREVRRGWLVLVYLISLLSSLLGLMMTRQAVTEKCSSGCEGRREMKKPRTHRRLGWPR
jgi:hypothetical protein